VSELCCDPLRKLTPLKGVLPNKGGVRREVREGAGEEERKGKEREGRG